MMPGPCLGDATWPQIPIDNVVSFFFFFFLVFRDRVSLCSPGWPGTHSVDQAGLKLRNPPASASQVLGLKACATMPGCGFFHSQEP
jgi:hypothetical protein